MENERILNNLIETAEILKKQIEGLNIQLQLIREQIDEHANTIETLNGYMDVEDSQILIDSGSSTYISFRPAEKKTALIRVGSNIYVEYDISKAKEILKGRIEDLKVLEDKAVEEIRKLGEQYNAVQNKIERLYSEISGRKNNVQRT